MSTPDIVPRLAELLCDRSLGGLDPEAQAELERLLAQVGLEPDVSLELAVAHVELLLAPEPTEKMPEALRTRIVAAPRPAPVPVARREAVVLPLAAEPAPARRAAPRWAWPLAAAAAALLGVAVGAALERPVSAPPVVAEAPSKDAPGQPRTPAEARADLLLRADDLVRIEWDATEDVAARGTRGDIVWSPSLQQGFMRFTGLAANDPSRSRYQLWIFDETRDERFPVDGGVFDVDRAEVVVPIRAKLPVGTASLFAVTVEPPKGVVVSDRERIVATAKPSAP